MVEEITEAITPPGPRRGGSGPLCLFTGHNYLSLVLPFSREGNAVQYNLQADCGELVDKS
jgi:hypothetical protein